MTQEQHQSRDMRYTLEHTQIALGRQVFKIIKGDGYSCIFEEKTRLFFCINGHFCTVFLSSQDEGKQTPITSSKCVFPYTQLHGKTLSCTTKSKVVMEEEGKLVVEVQ